MRKELTHATWQGKNSSGLKIQGWSVRRYKQPHFFFQDFLLVLSLHCSILLCQFLQSSEGSAFPFPVVFTGKQSQTKCRCCAASQGVEYTGQAQGTGGKSSSFIHIYLYILVVLRLSSQTCRPQGLYSHQQHGQGQMRKALLFIIGQEWPC